MDIGWYLVLLLIVCIAGIIFWYRHRRGEAKFIHALLQQIELLKSKEGALNLGDIPPEQLTQLDVPKKYLSLYCAWRQFINGLPVPNDKDKLTGLANRLGLKSRFLTLMPITQGTLVLIDIYQFRFVNDLFGFSVGDKLLQILSERLQGEGNNVSFLARMNEDEFLLYFEQAQDEAKLLAIREKLQMPFNIQDIPITVQIQMGYLDLAQHHTYVSQLLRRLDLALIKAKEDKQLFASYSEGDDLSQQRQLGIINRLPKALARGELYMVYQPKLDVLNGGFSQVEALIRWEHEDLGMVSPAEFIPLAEYAGMIGLVSEWALDQVISQQYKWHQSGLLLQVAVNLSSKDIISSTLCDDIQMKFDKYGLETKLLSIEITESKLMDDMEMAVETIEKLKAIGVDVAIDDFGTGHSSLAYLKYFPVDEVKIDKAFIDELMSDKHAKHIMKSSIELAKGLDFKVTVEGVETEEVKSLLVEMGVDKIQGDLFAKPMSALELEVNWQQLQLRK
ncbi:putative bifunctional diguanylate cyclase/phosphodiesterase [Shewanella woodyi]|uniref:Diguanylate cyclase/phosphodiesterase n=1 Tax=Shewanella woodyi (strain ATCC 51908 / MS32) TaxID=392500 RepID=B1KRK9_SHEWM|nr:EAL domain-containing protein [Shewanella woodyi]ACA87774.1 diguanylate cyclase/phosphodiesterase [Shewanella woodyi ATCC 51908]